jgi:hypothetical protein
VEESRWEGTQLCDYSSDLELAAVRGQHFYGIAALEGRAVQRLSGDARLRVAVRDPRLLGLVVGQQIEQPVAVSPPVTAPK